MDPLGAPKPGVKDAASKGFFPSSIQPRDLDKPWELSKRSPQKPQKNTAADPQVCFFSFFLFTYKSCILLIKNILIYMWNLHFFFLSTYDFLNLHMQLAQRTKAMIQLVSKPGSTRLAAPDSSRMREEVPQSRARMYHIHMLFLSLTWNDARTYPLVASSVQAAGGDERAGGNHSRFSIHLLVEILISNRWNQISRQQLKIALNTKTKSYERLPERLQGWAADCCASAALRRG